MRCRPMVRVGLFVALLLRFPAPLHAQPTATLQGQVFDPSGAVVPNAIISVRHLETGLERSAGVDRAGRYQLAAMPPGRYAVTVRAEGFRPAVIEALTLEVGHAAARDFRLEVGGAREAIAVRAESPLVERVRSVVGHTVTLRTVEEAPLNGRHFVDLGLLVPGSVTASQTGFSTTPFRGIGALSINTAGNREEAVGFLINGVASNNLTNGSLGFQPPVASIQEFRADNSAFPAEHGHVSGAVVNIVTRSGTDEFHGDAYEFLRNDRFDARNFFEITSPEPHPFERHQFGGSLGGPVIPGRSHFFATYEGVRQRQGVDLNSLVPSDAEREAVTSPAVRRLVELLPRANVVDADGTPRFVGSAAARVDMDRWTVDLRQKLGDTHLHAFYGRQQYTTNEPTSNGNSVPGFGYRREPRTSVLTLEALHVVDPTVLNEARAGVSRLAGTTYPATPFNPADFGIRNGITRPLGLPQIVVAGGLNFGGPASNPVGRSDASYVISDTLTAIRSRHTIKTGVEFRHFVNENTAEGTGLFNFPSVPAFLAGEANAFSITLGERRNQIDQRALGVFLQDSIALAPGLTADLGIRYEWHVTPTERSNQFVVFDRGTASLVRVGIDVPEVYRQNDRNLEPRVGLSWVPAEDGRFVVRAAYAHAVDEPTTSVVSATASNPPFATPLTASGTIPLEGAIDAVRPAGLSPATVDPGFRNAWLRSWNVNVQQLLASDLSVMAGYFGSRGRDLRLSRNINQPVDGVRPFPALSPSSPILPGAPLGNITQVESTGFSRYDALWLSARKRLSGGLQFDTSYTLSRSLDTNSLNTTGFAIQDSYDIAGQYGPSDFDARHRFVLSAIYALPFDAHALLRDWQVAAIVQSQSGNPVNIVTSNSTLNGVPNTVRPDVVGPIRILGEPDRWFDTSVFVAHDRFGRLGRNAVGGPGFHSTDISITKTIGLRHEARLQLRADVFNVFNHTNFGPPGNVVGSPTFGKIARTRFPTGEAGSSRQVQVAANVWF